MRITGCRATPAATAALGLDEVEFRRLGPVVALVGPNGSGKTRILRLVREGLEHPEHNWLENVSRDTDGQALNLARFGPRAFTLQPTSYLNSRDLETKAEQAKQIGEHGALHELGPAYVQRVVERYAWAFAPGGGVAAPAAVEAFDSLRKVFADLLKLDLALDREQRKATLGGFAIGAQPMSEGQAALFQLGVILHAQQAQLGSVILFWDEPEAHLHPAAVVEVFERIQSANTGGQIWLATHSDALVAHLEPEALWYINERRARWAGTQPEKVIAGLFGGEEGAERLTTFLGMPLRFAAVRFAADCLFEPAVLGVTDSDDQCELIRSCLPARPAERRLRLLDFGAGQGRFLGTLATMLGVEWVRDEIDYFAFDSSPEHRAELDQTIREIWPDDADARLLADAERLERMGGAGGADVVLLCNVLHEIPPQRWLDNFGPNGLITRSLTPGGLLMVVEDYGMPRGEKAHQSGFLLLDSQELQALFSTTEVKTATARAGRLAAHVIPAERVGGVTTETCRAAIGLVQGNAMDRVREIRASGDVSYKQGLRHALATQLAVNANLALDLLGT